MFNEGYRDRSIVCRDCGNEFTFTAGEQEFYAGKGLTNEPGRCPTCRAARRGGQQNSSRAPRDQQREPREQHDAICASCGRQTTVPFVPREDRPVYCSDCFQSQRTSRPPRDDTRSYSSGNSYGGGGNSGARGRGGRDRNDRYERRERW
jgi:CxxC-x17-CxxC domain-containing protein